MTKAAPRASAAALALAAAFLSGLLLALQSRLNGTLSEHSGRPVIAALWSFGSGLVLLTIVALLSPRIGAAVHSLPRVVRSGQLRWYQCLGGVVGGLFVAAQTWTVPLIGVAIFSVATIGGQMLSAVGVDRAGFGTSGRHPVTAARLGFALLAVAGVAVTASGRAGGGAVSWLPVVVCVVIGAGIAVQQAINARVNSAVGQPLATTWQNFAFGTLTLGVVALIEWVSRPGAWHLPQGAPWWAWLGSLCGIAFIAMTAWAVQELGVLVFGLVAVAGQLLAALGLDLADASERPHVGAALVLGVGISLVAAIGAGIAQARARGRG